MLNFVCVCEIFKFCLCVVQISGPADDGPFISSATGQLQCSASALPCFHLTNHDPPQQLHHSPGSACLHAPPPELPAQRADPAASAVLSGKEFFNSVVALVLPHLMNMYTFYHF